MIFRRFSPPLLVTAAAGLFLLGGPLAPDAHATRPRRASSSAAPTRTRAAEPAQPEIPVTFLPGAPTPPRVLARSGIVVDARTGRVLYEKNPDERRPAASTTKLLTGLIIAESGGLDAPVQVETVDTLCEPTKSYAKPGEVYSRRQMLNALLVHSCNDLARALARDHAGSLDAFADRMNRRSAGLGATDSVWTSPNGLPTPGETQYSTARDLAKIARAAYYNPTLRNIVRQPRLIFQFNDGHTTEWENTNKVLRRWPFCNGMKTGYTNAAGHCLVSSAASSERDVICVLLGDNKAIWNDSQGLLEWALTLSN